MNGVNGNGRDKFFVRVMLILAVIVVLFGAASILLAIYLKPSDPVILRIIGGIGSMFAGLVGLAVGYLSGRR